MELDELKHAWAEASLRLDGMEALLRTEVRDRHAGKARASLRPLEWGQWLQLGTGVALAVLGGVLWTTHLQQIAVLVCGLVAHAYGLLSMVFSTRNLYLIHRIDYAAPVLEIQRRLARLRAFRVRVEAPVNAVAGCFLWIPVLWASLAWYGIDLWSPGFIRWGIASGLAGLVSIVAVVWIMRRMGYGRRIDDHNAGKGIVRAQAALDEIACFERE